MGAFLAKKGAFFKKKHTKKTRKSRRNSRKTRRSRRYTQRGGDSEPSSGYGGSVSWTPQTDRKGDPDAVGGVTSIEKFNEHKNNELTDSY